MPDTLRLEFVCTPAELEHAQSLHLERKIGGGSKVLTRIVLLLILAGIVLAFCLRIQHEVAPAYRPYAYAAAVACCLAVWAWRRRSGQAEPSATVVDVSEGGLAVRSSGGEARMPWSAFGRLLESPQTFVLVDRAGTVLLPIPRRAFPDEGWQDWFQTLATNRLGLAERPAADAPPAPPADGGDTVRLTPAPRFADFLDRALASWIPRGFIAWFAAMFIGIAVYSGANPPPNQVFSATQVFFMFLLPFLFVQAAVVILIITVRSWWLHSRGAVREELSLSDESIGFGGIDGSGTLPWSTYDRYKETRRNFLVWSTRTPVWLMLPKRSFATVEDVDRCREMLANRLRRSTWYFGF